MSMDITHYTNKNLAYWKSIAKDRDLIKKKVDKIYQQLETDTESEPEEYEHLNKPEEPIHLSLPCVTSALASLQQNCWLTKSRYGYGIIFTRCLFHTRGAIVCWSAIETVFLFRLWVRQQPSTLAGASVVPLLRTLRWCGFCRLPPAATDRQPTVFERMSRSAHDAYCAFALAVTSTYLVQELIYAYLERGDMDTMARVMFLLLCHVTSLAKQIVFMARASRIAKLVQDLDDLAYNPDEETRKSLLTERAKGASRLGAIYAGAAALTCILWTIFPFLTRLGGTRVVFALWIPFDYYPWPEFLVVLIYTHYGTSLVGIANTTMDAFIAVVLGQCKTQLTILKMDFESLAERAIARAGETGERLGAASVSLLVSCISHHHKICETSRELQAIFGSAVLLQFAIGGWILCMAAYKMVGLSITSGEFISMLMFLMCILTELFLYCFYGNEVAVESAQVSDSVYGMEWVGKDGVGREVQSALPFVICCSAGAARRPLRPAALFIPLSLETFVTIIKSSYTFYAMIHQTQH